MTPKNLHYGDIWLVQSSPSIGHEYVGTRPAVIVQHKDLPHDKGLASVMLMSSFKGKRWRSDILIEPDPLTNRLRVPSLVKVQHIQSYDTVRFLKRIGTLDGKIMDALKTSISIHFNVYAPHP